MENRKVEANKLEANTNVYNYLCCQIIGLIFYPLKLRLIIIYPAIFSICPILLDFLLRTTFSTRCSEKHAGPLNVSVWYRSRIAKTINHLTYGCSENGICISPYLYEKNHQIQKSTKSTSINFVTALFVDLRLETYLIKTEVSRNRVANF